jgi:HAD superfamily hydrolase (TIGR01490 family)
MSGESASQDARTPSQKSGARGAAFYDVDGTLIRGNIVHAFAWYAANQPTLWGSAVKTISTVLSVPVFAVSDKLSRKLFNELFYGYYKGQSEDRLWILSEELFEKVIRKSLREGAPDLVDQAKRAGLVPVLVSGGLDFTVWPLARHLGIEHVIANRLEFVRGYATGQLRKPLVAGATKAHVMRELARELGVDLAASYAYTDSYSDYAMLSVVGYPTAVNPDLRLRTVARSYDWPVLDLGS